MRYLLILVQIFWLILCTPLAFIVFWLMESVELARLWASFFDEKMKK